MIGESVPRVEDLRFLTGSGRFVEDLEIPGALHCAFVRSPHSHARIRGIHGKALTGRDMAADGVGPMRAGWALPGMVELPRWAMARDVVRHVGEPVAVVFAESRAAAEDAAEQVEVEYESLAPASEACFRWTRGDAAAVEKAFSSAAHRVKLDLVNNRLCGAAIENRAMAAVPGPDGLTLYCATQAPHHLRHALCGELGIREIELRIVSPDMGGGFGSKGKHYPEETVVCWAARRLRRPVRWSATRRESFLSDTQGRDHRTRAELALDAEGHFLGLRVSTRADVGAYVSTFGAAIPGPIYSALLAGVYRTPAIYVEVNGFYSNTVPTDAYRGAGRPEACYVLERLADAAARKLGIDRAEIRRRNLIPKEAMPYKTPIGPTYDCGDFPRMLERALQMSDYAGFPDRKEGKMRGIGIACYVESSGVAPSRLAGMMGARFGFYESAQVRVAPDGSVAGYLGTHNHGQGHATTFAQILAAQLGIPMERISIHEGDTAEVPVGTGTFGSRSIAVGGSALHVATGKVIEKGKKIAAHLLEAAANDIEFEQGMFRVAGTDRGVTFAQVAGAAYVPHNYPLDVLEPGLDENAFYDPPNFAFSNGVHVCEVDVDPETGAARIVGYWAVDDIGTVINPMIVEGQLHGGLAQGIGQAMAERTVYDDGQLLSASFMDYAVPRADTTPSFRTLIMEVPASSHPHGIRPGGEGGTTPALGLVVNAIAHALAAYGVRDVPMPATPLRVWQAIRAATAGEA